MLLCNLRLAYMCRRRLTCLLAMDRRGTVAVVEEVPPEIESVMWRRREERIERRVRDFSSLRFGGLQ